MTFVKEIPEDERHLLMYLGMLADEIRDAFAEEDWGGLRQSHFRVITCVPPEGVTVTELAQRVRMTKQGCGQFVSRLVETGHLVAEADPGDRRLRIVRRTPLGDRTVKAVAARIARIERAWEREVGVRRFRGFRSVVEALAMREPD